MVDRGSQGNPAVARAAGARFAAGPTVFYPLVVTAEAERSSACSNRADRSGQAELRQVSEPKCNFEAIKLEPQRTRGFTGEQPRGVFPCGFSPVVLCVACGYDFCRSLSEGRWDLNRRQEARLLPCLRQLLERLRDLEQRRLAPCAPEEGDPNRQSPQVSRRHIDIGIAGNSGGARTASGGVVAIDQVGKPCRACRGRDERVEFELVHDEVDALGAAEFLIQRQRIEIFFCVERTLLLRLEKNILPEVRHFPVAIAFVELNHIFQTLNRSITTARDRKS